MELSRDLEIIALQERELQFRSFNADVAWQLGLRIRELAVSRSASVVIDVRHFGQTPLRCARRNFRDYADLALPNDAD